MYLLNTPFSRCIIIFAALSAWIQGCSSKVNTITPVSCIFSLSPSSAAYTASENTGSVMVNTSPNCPWTANSDVDWISITGTSSGRGNGTVTYHVARNVINSDREAAIEVVETEIDDSIVTQQIHQFAAKELHIRGAYTFVLEIDPDGTCEWPVTKFYWPVVIKETSHAEGITIGSVRFPATAVSYSNTWSFSTSLTKTELVPCQQSPGTAGRGYELVVDGGSWVAGGFSQAPDGRGEIKGGTASGSTQTLKLRDTDERWECQSEAKWSLLIRYTDKD